MPEINEGMQTLVGQLVETQIPAELELIDKKMQILKKIKA